VNLRAFSSDCYPTSDFVRPPPTRSSRDHYKCVYVRVCVFVCVDLRTLEKPTTKHSGTPELLRAAKPHLPPSISNRLPRPVCYIIKNESCSEMRLRVFAARTLSAVILCHCLDNNAPRISNRSLECLVMSGDFAASQLHVVARTFTNRKQLLASPRKNTMIKRRKALP